MGYLISTFRVKSGTGWEEKCGVFEEVAFAIVEGNDGQVC